MRAIFGTLFALALAFPAAAQEPGDTVELARSAEVPVWVLVEDVDDEAGAHRVRVAVVWEDWRHGFRFSEEVLPGELVVLVAKSEDPARAETCDYASALMLHESEGFQPFERADTDCLAPPAEYLPWIAAEHRGSPMVCDEASRTGNQDPAIRVYGCYFAEKPTPGG